MMAKYGGTIVGMDTLRRMMEEVGCGLPSSVLLAM